MGGFGESVGGVVSFIVIFRIRSLKSLSPVSDSIGVLEELMGLDMTAASVSGQDSPLDDVITYADHLSALQYPVYLPLILFLEANPLHERPLQVEVPVPT